MVLFLYYCLALILFPSLLNIKYDLFILNIVIFCIAIYAFIFYFSIFFYLDLKCKFIIKGKFHVFK